MVTFSIITITFNAEKYLEKTIQSIVNQTDTDFEYLLIDGASRDNTLAIAQRYKKWFKEIISEPDKGLYDAMNKGLALAKGKYVWFMNAGDEIAHPHVIADLKQLLTPSTDVLYGETYFINEQGDILGKRSDLTPHKLPSRLHWRQMKHGMLVCHQAFIARRSMAPPFTLGNLSADVDWEISILKQAKEITYYPKVMAKYLVGGISNQQLKKSLTDRFKVLVKHFGWWEALTAHAYMAVRGAKKIFREGGKYW